MHNGAVCALQITVDGDTSTNDTVLALASGAAGAAVITDPASAAAETLEAAVTAVLQGLAKAIAWDGEGATCLLEITCAGASSQEDALTVAKSVAASSLTKSAIFGHDPNWGRIACAAGYSGASLPSAPAAHHSCTHWHRALGCVCLRLVVRFAMNIGQVWDECTERRRNMHASGSSWACSNVAAPATLPRAAQTLQRASQQLNTARGCITDTADKGPLQVPSLTRTS
jgi:hypothetical protein